MVVYILAQDARVGSLNRLTAKLGFEALGEEVRRRVQEDSGIELQWEIRRIGIAGHRDRGDAA